jgi:hypothetical protein
MKPIDEDEVCFRGHEQAAQDGSQAWRPRRAGYEGAHREARPQRPLPVRLSEVVSSAVACAAVAFDGVNRDHYQR